MTVAVTHTFVTAIADDGTPVGGVQPSHWNAGHTVTGVQAQLAPTAVKTGAYNAVVNDLVPVDTTSGSVTITLPTAPADGSHICVKQVTRGGTNTVSVVTGGSDVFNKTGGATTATLTLSGAAQTYQYKSTGAIWYVVADDMPYANLLANAQSWAGQQTFVAPILGAPASGTLTNCTGLPAAGVVGTAAVLGGNAFTGSNSTTLSIAATSTDGHVLTNTTAAAAGAQQWSPRLHFTGQGWKTTATAASQTVDWIVELVPVQGAANPAANLVFSSSINGAGYTSQFSLLSSGVFSMPDAAVFSGSGKWQVFNSTGSSRYYTLNAGVTTIVSGGSYGIVSSSTDSNNNADVLWSRSASATWQQGAANAASPVAQILQAQGSRSGTDTNIAGANYTHSSGLGTGNAAGSSLILAAPLAVASGTGAQTLTEVARINTTVGLTVASGYAVKLGNAAVTGLAAGVLAATTNATITLVDSGGTTYRIPCII